MSRLEESDRELRWQKALARARVRYRSEIRKYRGIDRIRRLYSSKKGRGN